MRSFSSVVSRRPPVVGHLCGRGPWLAVPVAGLLALAPGVARAETIALLPASGAGIHPGLLEAANEVARDHLQRTGRYVVITLPGQPGAVEPSIAEAIERARAVGADLAGVLRFTRLGASMRVRLAAYRVASAGVAYWDSTTTSGTPDDLDPLLARLAAGMAAGKPMRDTAELETVTDKEETEELRKRRTSRTFGVRVGTMLVIDRAGGGNGTVPGIGAYWLYDARSWLADLGADFSHAGDDGAFSMGLGAYYPLRRTDVTWYAGGSARWATSHFGGRGQDGLVLQPTLGLLIGRLSSVTIRGELGYFVNTYGEGARPLLAGGAAATPSGVGGDEHPTVHFSHGPALSVGFSF